MKTDFGRWKDEDESEDEAESPYQDNNLNSVSLVAIVIDNFLFQEIFL